MGDKCNCYRFSPRDSLSGAVAQIADYLSKHPGWNETELRAFVDGLISSAGVETFNGRSGNVTLNKDDVNNLLIANCYFAEADETIESIDVLALYKLGIRIVFTQYSSEVDGYTLAYGIEYYPATDTAKAYLFSSGSGGVGAVVSVNGKTGTVVLRASDILMNNGDSVEHAVSNAKAIANAAYSPDNTPPYPVKSVNSKTGSVMLKVVDVSNGDSADDNAYIFIDETENYPDIIAPDSNKLGGQIPSYYATAESVNSLKGDKVDKDEILNAGIKSFSFVPMFGGEFTVTTVDEEGYISPHSLASVTGRISKHYTYRITFNGEIYELPCGLYYFNDMGDRKLVEYLGNLSLFTEDTSFSTHDIRNVPFCIISDLDNNSSIDVFTQSPNMNSILVEQIQKEQIVFPKSLVWGDDYCPIEFKRNDGTYSGVSIGLNLLKNTRGTFAIGVGNKVYGDFSQALGSNCEVSGTGAMAVGSYTTANGVASHAEGYKTTATGNASHAEGNMTTANGMASHAEGTQTTTNGNASHAEGYMTTATGNSSHAEGQKCIANGHLSHSGGNLSEANGRASFAHGNFVKATHPSQFVIGYGNNPQEDSIFEIGNGLDANGQPANTGNTEPVTRQNAFRVTQSGVAVVKTGLQIGNTIINEEQLQKIIALIN